MVNNHENTQNGLKSTNYRSKTVTFWARVRKVLFSKRSAKMIDGSGKRKKKKRCKNPWKLYSKLHEEFARSLIIWGNFTFLRHHLFHFSLFLSVCFCFVPFFTLRALVVSPCPEEVWVRGLCHHTDLTPWATHSILETRQRISRAFDELTKLPLWPRQLKTTLITRKCICFGKSRAKKKKFTINQRYDNACSSWWVIYR